MNTLYYGDNLKILRDVLSEPGAVATGFLNSDPPSNSNWNSNFIGKAVNVPPNMTTFKQAGKISQGDAKQQSLRFA